MWSPSGNRLAFVRRRSGHRQIFLCDGDGSSVRRLTRDPAQASDPTWSPNGMRLAFTSTRDGHPEVYAIDVDGRDERRLTDDPTGASQPDWSPEGKRIAFTTRRAGTLDIWVMNSDGFAPRPVTVLPGAESDADWRPGGLQIAFAAETAGDSDIVVVNADGSGARPLTSGGATDRFPSWAPTGGAIAFTRGRGSARSTFVTATAADATDAPRREIANGVRASWGALPIALDDPAVLDAGTVAITPVAGTPTVSPPDSTQQYQVAPRGPAAGRASRPSQREPISRRGRNEITPAPSCVSLLGAVEQVQRGH